MSEKELKGVFDQIRNNLRIREDQLLQRLDDVMKRKKTILTTQLDDMSVALDNTRHCIEVAERLLANTNGVKGGKAYVLATSRSISARCDQLDENIVAIPFEPLTDPKIRASFIEQEVTLIGKIVESLGAILTRDNIPSEDMLSLTFNDDISLVKGAVDDEKEEAGASNSEDELTTVPPTSSMKGDCVTFTLKTR